MDRIEVENWKRWTLSGKRFCKLRLEVLKSLILGIFSEPYIIFIITN